VNKKFTAASEGDLLRLSKRVREDLFEIFPQLEGKPTWPLVSAKTAYRRIIAKLTVILCLLPGKIDHGEVRGPYQQGLSHNPERYAAKGVRVDTPYPGLYLGGSDLTVGDSISGANVAAWLVANTVCGYSAVDHLFLNKNITTDLEQFLEPPTLTDEEDLAVPYTLKTVDERVDDEHEEL
jgi:hypothetical protein